MAPYSRLVLSEMIVADHQPSVNQCIADIGIMVIGGQERSKAQWTELLRSEDFRVRAFYGEGNAVNGVIEAEKIPEPISTGPEHRMP